MAHDLAIIFRIFPSVSQSLGSARLCPPATAASGNLERLEPVSCAAFFIQSPATCVQMEVEYSMKTMKIVRSHSPKSWFMGSMLCPQRLKKNTHGRLFLCICERERSNGYAMLLLEAEDCRSLDVHEFHRVSTNLWDTKVLTRPNSQRAWE